MKGGLRRGEKKKCNKGRTGKNCTTIDSEKPAKREGTTPCAGMTGVRKGGNSNKSWVDGRKSLMLGSPGSRNRLTGIGKPRGVGKVEIASEQRRVVGNVE